MIEPVLLTKGVLGVRLSLGATKVILLYAVILFFTTLFSCQTNSLKNIKKL